MQSNAMPDSLISSNIQSKLGRNIHSYIQNQLQCELCTYQYNLSDRVPFMLCQNQHNCCLICINEIIMMKNQKYCPYCRQKIVVNRLQKNRTLCRLLQQYYKRNNISYENNQFPEKSIIGYNKNKIAIIHQQQNPLYHSFLSDGQIAPEYDNQFFPEEEILIHLLLGQQRPPQSFCSKIYRRLQFKDSLYCFIYFITFIFMTPFAICQLFYSISLEQQPCMDSDYGVGINLRTWLLSSGILGLSITFLQFLIILWKIFLPYRTNCPKNASLINLLCFVLKFLGYNIFGIVVINNVSAEDLGTCNSSVQSYMGAIFIIQIVALSFLCALADRR